MAVSGLPEKCSSHAKCIAKLALDMMDLVQQIEYPDIEVVSGIQTSALWYYKQIIVFPNLHNEKAS